jgi:hypothetical protein
MRGFCAASAARHDCFNPSNNDKLYYFSSIRNDDHENDYFCKKKNHSHLSAIEDSCPLGIVCFAKQNDSHLAEVKRNPRVCLCKAKSKVGSNRRAVLDWQYWVGGPSLVERRGHFFYK